MADNYALIKSYAKSPEILSRFSEIVGENNAASYIYSVIIAVSSDDRLQQCTPQSIMKAAARAATLGMSCDPSIGQAYLVPYGNEATFQIGWRGLRDMAYRTGKILYINVNALYEGQEWIEDQMTGQARIEGQATSHNEIGYFAYIETKDHRVNTRYMSKEEIDMHKERYAKGWKRTGSAWQTAYDKMARKTVLKQLLSTWAELSSDENRYFESVDVIDSIEDMPTVDEVTIVEPERRSQAQIMSELGFESKERETYDYDPNEDDEDYDDNGVPKTQSTYMACVAAGEVPYIGMGDAQKVLKDSKGEIDVAWQVIHDMSEERMAANKKSGGKSANQDSLL